MKKLRKTLENTKRATNFVDNNEIKRRLEFARVSSKEELFQKFKTSDKGLSEEQVEISREQYGDNSITRGKKTSLIKRLYQAFINPFTIILFVLALVSAFTDIILAAPGEKKSTRTNHHYHNGFNFWNLTICSRNKKWKCCRKSPKNDYDNHKRS